MRVNVGGDHGQDDYGLPPVDIEIPDDARELDADVQAYHRELRAQRRMRIMRRIRAPFTRNGMVMPLLAGCMALTLLAGTLLTIFTGSDGMGLVPNQPHAIAGPAHHASPRAAQPAGAPRTRSTFRAATGQPGGPLPDTLVTVGGKPTELRALSPAVLALIPPGCLCGSRLRALAGRASAIGAPVYVVGLDGVRVARLAKRLGLPGWRAVEDIGRGLADYYHPAGLTAVIVRGDGTVTAVLPAVTAPGAIEEAMRSITVTPAAPRR
jgi:hypothetical protein